MNGKKNKMEKIKIALTGDVLMTHQIPPYESSKCIKDFFKTHDCVIGNLETVIRDDIDGYPEAFPGGGSVFATPNCLKELKEWGFNMFSTANNHSMDYGHGGLLATNRNLDYYGFKHAGTGDNLAKASSACYFETAKGRIALLSVTSSFHDSYLAGPQNQESCGRPGVSPLRHKALYELPSVDFGKLSEIANKSGINSYHDQARKEGYLLDTENLKFGSFEFKEGNKYSLSTSPLQIDLDRTLSAIKEARFNSDVVIVSVHSHQFAQEKNKSPEFLEKFARKCCNEGADVVFCHGPHVIRGVEICSNSAIFYGLGNFIFQHEGMEYLPEEMYNKYGLERNNVSGPSVLFEKRSKGGKIGLMKNKDAWNSFLVSLEISEKTIEIHLLPIVIMQDEICKGFKGMPRLVNNKETLDKLVFLSSEYGTCITICDNLGKIQINRK